MSKHNLSLVFLSETIMVAAVSLFCGLIGGISLSKLAELAMTKMLFDESSYDFYVNTEALQDSLLFFVLIFALIFLNGLRQIHQSNAVSLLHSENAGEQPPRANYLLGFGGFVVLAAAYYIAVSIESPLSALSWFFIAVWSLWQPMRCLSRVQLSCAGFYKKTNVIIIKRIILSPYPPWHTA